jgi:GH35 family endo-1,4-beta-xylanase
MSGDSPAGLKAVVANTHPGNHCDAHHVRNIIFYETLGETYIDEAFHAAHEADPNALLFYNESNIEWSADKLEATHELVQRLLATDVPIDGCIVNRSKHE